MIPLGMEINELFIKCIDENETNNIELKPLLNNIKEYKIDIYQGLFYECCKNIKVKTITIPYNEVWRFEFLKKDNVVTIFMNNKYIDKIKLITKEEDCKHRYSYIQNKLTDQKWYLLYQSKQSYIEYIHNSKSILYDDSIKQKIDKINPTYPTYHKIIEKLEKAELICQLGDVTKNEYDCAKKEMENIIDPIMNMIINKTN